MNSLEKQSLKEIKDSFTLDKCEICDSSFLVTNHFSRNLCPRHINFFNIEMIKARLNSNQIIDYTMSTIF